MPAILIRFPHGLGDVCQFSVVLKHLKKHRPWDVDVRCGRGKHTALLGLCRRVYHDQEPEPLGPYDSMTTLGWYENYNRYVDRPNSKITSCLAEVFGIEWEPDLGRYTVNVSSSARHRAASWLSSTAGCHGLGGKMNAVVIHYEGNTSPWKKNLSHWQVAPLVDLITAAGRVPIILDWDRRSTLLDDKRVYNPGVGPGDVWGQFGSGDAETIAALIGCAEAFIGIDSGPGKIASATDTPSLICWRGHHPIQFHDPAPNTTHLVPYNHRSVTPAGDDHRIGDWFEAHYKWRSYEGEHGLVAEAADWLGEVLGCQRKGKDMAPITFVCPRGIGDVAWCLAKMRGVAAGRRIEVVLAGDPREEVDRRTVPFLRRFPWITDVKVIDLPYLEDKDHPTDSRGRYRYLSDGRRGTYWYLMPNRTLESGRRLEEWLPDVPCDWGFMDEFSWADTEKGSRLGDELGDFVALYLGPERGNTEEGHNRGWLWNTQQWTDLALGMKARGMNLAVVGALYDKSFWERYVREGFDAAGVTCVDVIGRMEIGETFALLKKSRCLVSYQCGLAIVGHYLGINAVSWWRPEGDSLSPENHVSFSDEMRNAWIRPGWEEKWMGLVYGRQGPGEILEEIDRRGWLRKEDDDGQANGKQEPRLHSQG